MTGTASSSFADIATANISYLLVTDSTKPPADPDAPIELPPLDEPHELTPAENWYAHERIEAFLRANPWANDRLGKALDVSGMTIGRIRAGRAVGLRVGTRLAELLGLSWDEFRRRAVEAYAELPPAPVVPQTPAAPEVASAPQPTPLPNQLRALEVAGEDRESDLGKTYLSMRHKLRADKPVDWWLARLQHFRAILEAEAEQTPEQALESQYRQQQMLDAMQAKVQPVPAGATTPPSKPRKKPAK